MANGDLRLKERMEELVGTLDKVMKGSELRYQQNAELVSDLRAANTALVSTLDRCKKKYQGRLKKLEAQMMSLVERHAQQVQKILSNFTVEKFPGKKIIIQSEIIGGSSLSELLNYYLSRFRLIN